MTRPAHHDIGDARSEAHLETLAQMRRLERYHDEPGGASRLPEIRSQADIDASSGPWKHPPRPAKRPGLIRHGLALIVAIAALWAFAAFANATVSAALHPCPTLGC